MSPTPSVRTGPTLRAWTVLAAVLAVLASTLIAVAPAAAQTVPPDVTAGNVHRANILALYERGITGGKADGTFGVRDNLSREQLATLLANADDIPGVAQGPFSDVSGTHAANINALHARGIVSGLTPTTFGPRQAIRRDQVATILANWLQLEPVETGPFDDVRTNTHRRSINALHAAGIAGGTTERAYDPSGLIRREQLATLLIAALDHRGDGGTSDPVTRVTRTTTFDGTSLSLELAADAVTGLDEDGDTVRVTGSGFPGDGVATGGADCAGNGSDPACGGIYVSVCVLSAAQAQAPPYPANGQSAPSPCLGGVDLEGEGGSSAWISDDPPAYGATLVTPYGPDGSFDLELDIAASDGTADCLAAPHGCAIITRRDHLASADRSLDLYLPITFGDDGDDGDDGDGGDDEEVPSATTPGTSSVTAGGTVELRGTGFAPGETVEAAIPAATTTSGVQRSDATTTVIGTARATADGRVTINATVPDRAPGQVTVTLRGRTSDRTATTVITVLAKDTDPAGNGGPADWGIRQSFRNYITGNIANGTITVREPATRNSDGTFRFAAGTATVASNGRVDVTFRGTAHFIGHGGLLEFELSNPRVSITPGQVGTLRADVRSKSLDSGQVVSYPNVHFADLDARGRTASTSGSIVTWSALPATLTAAGAPAFAGFYQPGEALDPFTFSYSTTGTTPPGTDPPPTTTPPAATPPAGPVTAGSPVPVGASGFQPGETVNAYAVVPAATGTFTVQASTSNEILIGSGIARTDGAVTFDVTFPEDTPSGPVTVVLRGASSGRSATTSVQVEGVDPDPVWEPEITVSRTEDLEVGDTITVTGTGFDPVANTSTRQPVTVGQPAGVYVVFGKFADTWRPSDGAGSGARTVISQKWAMPQASRDQVSTQFPSQAAQLVTLQPDGSFEAELTVGERDTAGDYGVYTYAGGGAAANAAQELAVPVTLAEPDPDPWVPEISVSQTEGLEAGDTITVTGTGFDPTANISTRQPVTVGQPAGVYVVFGRFPDPWRPSQGVTSGRTVISQRWAMPQASLSQVSTQFPSQAAQLVLLDEDGSFEAELTVDERDVAGNYGVYVYPGGGATNADHELEQLVTFAEPDPEPEPEPATFGADWGVRASFRNYIVGPIANGSITVDLPATRNEDGTFRFALDEVDTDGELDVSASFDGAVHFEGHDYAAGPLLQMSVSGLRVEIDGDGGRIVADVVSKSLASGELETYDDVHFADLDLSEVTPSAEDGVVTWSAIPATLTEDGVPAFADFYDAGSDLDPITISYEGELPDPDDDPVVEAGPADWGIRASFRNYVLSPIASGSITVDAPATTNGDGTFRFAPGGIDIDEDGTITASFEGRVRFVGHGGILEMEVADPRIVLAPGGSGSLRADVVSREFIDTVTQGELIAYDDVLFADLDATAVTPAEDDGRIAWSGLVATLTEQGAEAFGGFYQPGETLDPFSFSYTSP